MKTACQKQTTLQSRWRYFNMWSKVYLPILWKDLKLEHLLNKIYNIVQMFWVSPIFLKKNLSASLAEQKRICNQQRVKKRKAK